MLPSSSGHAIPRTGQITSGFKRQTSLRGGDHSLRARVRLSCMHVPAERAHGLRDGGLDGVDERCVTGRPLQKHVLPEMTAWVEHPREVGWSCMFQKLALPLPGDSVASV